MDIKIAALIDNQIEKLKKELSSRSFNKVYMVGCGGGVAIFRHCEYVLRKIRPSFEYELIHAANLLVEQPVEVNEKALVICYSLNGTMKEAVEALRWVKSRGAYVVGITRTPQTPFHTEPDFTFMFYREEDYGHPYVTAAPVTLLVTYAVLEVLDGNKDFAHVRENLTRLDKVFDRARQVYVKEKGPEFVERIKDAPMVYTVGGGLYFTCAYVLATCYLLEMQWINASPVDAAEFFHGPLEIVDKDSHFVVFRSASEYRPLEDRVLSFLDRFTRGTFVIDAEDFGLDEIDDDFRTLASFIACDDLIGQMVTLLADARFHPIDTRRYYLKMDY